MSSNIFLSPEGRLKDLEYAQEAANLGSTTLGIKTKFFIFILSEKKKKNNIDFQNDQKIHVLDKTKGCCVSGLISDSRKIIDKVRIYCENKFFLLNSYPNLEDCAELINKLTVFNNISNDEDKNSTRPIGASFLLFGKDNNKFELIKVEPSGCYIKKKILTIGEGSNDGLFILQEGYRVNMKISETKILALKTLRSITESTINEGNIEAAMLTKTSNLTILLKQEIIDTLRMI